ncbi:MAG: hypothetical protein QHJ81_14815 [Anaerolineae bacterium]|nr:hypothetical protein [Anaerolineae bacterium]
MAEQAPNRDTHSVLGLRVWLTRQPFRLAPAWAVLAGALASGGLRGRRDNVLLLALAIVLADGLWGWLWALLVRRGHSASAGATPPLPYAAPEAPAARLWRWLAGSVGNEESAQPVAAWQSLLMAVLFAFGLAALLGPAALALTAAALLAGLARYLLAGRWTGALAQAVFEIGLAWLLGHLLVGGLTWPMLPMLLAVGYVLLHAGALALRDRGGLWLLNLAQLIPLACLIAARQPLAAGALGITLLAPLAWQPWLRQSGEDDRESFDAHGYVRRAQVWWWAGMLLAAWAVAG